MFNIKPKTRVLEKDIINTIFEGACELLETIGFKLEHKETLHRLAEAGLKVDFEKHRVYVEPYVISKCLKSVPSVFNLYSQDRSSFITVGRDNVNYVADSTQIKVFDSREDAFRVPTAKDMLMHAHLVDNCENISVQAGMIVNEAPKAVADIYRYYLILKCSNKPVYSSFYSEESLNVFKKMQLLFAGNEDNIKDKPTHIIPANISSPLSWSEVSCINLVKAAEMGLPCWLIPIPLAGGTSPVTLLGTLVQITAENLSGLVVLQTINPGTVTIWGGGPTILDMKYGSSPMSTPESIMLGCANAEIGKYLSLPTATNTGRADSKSIDIQAGVETSSAFHFAALTGINLIRGSGSLSYASAQSMEKLIIDNEIAGLAKRMASGFMCGKEAFALDLIKELGVSAKGFIYSNHTFEWFKEEIYSPSDIFDRKPSIGEDHKHIINRAQSKVDNILKTYKGPIIDSNLQKELCQLMSDFANKYGFDKLPDDKIKSF